MEEWKTLPTEGDIYYLKGYLLILSTGPVKANTNVTWSIKEGGVEAGTYHPDGAWTSYNQTITKPTTQPVYWRSGVVAPIDSTFDISVTYTPEGQNQQATVNRQLKTRLLDPAIPALNGQFNTDVDMLQRGMIQIFALNQGRLGSYQRGYYQDNSNGQYYITKANNKFSKVADEVWNFQKFSMNLGASADKNADIVFLESLWNEFDLILQAGAIGAVNKNSPNYNGWVNQAITATSYAVPAGFGPGKTSADVVKALHIAESLGVHSNDVIPPLAINNVTVGQNAGGQGTNYHYYTDFGIGFGKMQPYNRQQPPQTGTFYNLYIPLQNIIASTYHLKAKQAQASSVPGANARVWHAIYGYNMGNVAASQTPAQLRAANTTGSQDADRAFNAMGVALPQTNSD